jgi:hypothetical protein
MLEGALSLPQAAALHSADACRECSITGSRAYSTGKK